MGIVTSCQKSKLNKFREETNRQNERIEMLELALSKTLFQLDQIRSENLDNFDIIRGSLRKINKQI